MDFGTLFSSYWWLLFPLAFFVAAGWNSFMRYQRVKAKTDVLKAYAQSGKEPPADLVAALERDEKRDDWDEDNSDSSSSGGGSTVFLVVLFSGLSAVFAYVGYMGWLGGERTSMYFVAMILGVLAAAFLFSGMFSGRKRR